ncbi:MAG: sulfurtransferase [Bacteroidales bacterium]|nr:sulfurtransferase [Bacteroidales bacterium]MCF8402658.1 sulfurtransferase [Bacteroidales bacterium]
MNIKIFLSIIISLIYVSSFAQGDIISAKQFMDLTKSSDKLVVIDASKESSYKVSHVKDAVNIPHSSLYKEGNIEGIIKTSQDLANIFGNNGITENSTIVVYDDGSQKYSTRVYWILKYLGAKDVKILHKDMDEWKKVRVPLTRMPGKITKATFKPSVNNSVIADMAYVKAHLTDGKVKLLDARLPAEYNGTSEKPVSKGHIPGAINLNHEDVLKSNNSFKSKADLEDIASKLGLTPADELIFYCRTSVRGAVLYVAFKEILGYNNVKVYDGAYTEWETKYDFEK